MSALRLLVALLATLAIAGCPAGPTTPADLQASLPDVAPAPDLAPCPITTYPQGPYGVQVGSTFSADFPLVDSTGSAASPADVFSPCGGGLLALRLSAAWCGPCQWAVAHGGELLSATRGRVHLWELLAADEQNLPVSSAALTRFAQLIPAGGAQATGRPLRHATLSHGLLPALGLSPTGTEHLPLVLLIDARTMKVAARLSDPDPDTLLGTAQQLLAKADGLTPPALTTPALIDGRFTRDRWAQIQAMALPAPLAAPPDPTNRVADSADAVALGGPLMFETNMGPGMMDCEFCHKPPVLFQDNSPTSRGIVATSQGPMFNLLDRNTPGLAATSFKRFQFWDGRADSQWMQALGPLENPREFSSDRMFIVRRVLASSLHAPAYQKVFGAPPDFSDMTRFPLHAMPGMATWDAMAPADQVLVNTVFSNIGKAIAAFVRRILPQPVALDSYAGGTLSALTSDQKDGLLAFFQLGCAQCHYGPFLNDNAFHALGFATGRQDQQPDPGRRAGLPTLLSSEFLGSGAYSDSPATGAAKLAGLSDDPIMQGQFSTPSLRGLTGTAPYGHGGSYADVSTVVKVLAAGGEAAGGLPTDPARDPALVQFDPSDARVAKLLLFLQTLGGLTTMP